MKKSSGLGGIIIEVQNNFQRPRSVRNEEKWEKLLMSMKQESQQLHFWRGLK